MRILPLLYAGLALLSQQMAVHAITPIPENNCGICGVGGWCVQYFTEQKCEHDSKKFAPKQCDETFYTITGGATISSVNICGDGSLLGDSEICAGLWSRRCSPQGVGFPLQGRIMN